MGRHTGFLDLHTGEIGRDSFGDVLDHQWVSSILQSCIGQVVGECKGQGSSIKRDSASSWLVNVVTVSQGVSMSNLRPQNGPSTQRAVVRHLAAEELHVLRIAFF